MLNEEKYNLETKLMDLREHSNSSVLLTNVGGSRISLEYSLSYCSESMGAHLVVEFVFFFCCRLQDNCFGLFKLLFTSLHIILLLLSKC